MELDGDVDDDDDDNKSDDDHRVFDGGLKVEIHSGGSPRKISCDGSHYWMEWTSHG